MTRALELGPVDSADLRGAVVLDIRPLAERYGGLGFIPGSIGFPVEEDAPDLGALVERSEGQPIVLACLSGRRSRVVTEILAESGLVTEPANLSSGLLGWQAAELPVAGVGMRWEVGAEARRVPPPICRDIAACFMAEAIELSLDGGVDVDPSQLFARCCAEANVDQHAPDLGGILRLLDNAAARTRTLGNAYDRIAANIDKILELLGLPTDPAIGAA